MQGECSVCPPFHPYSLLFLPSASFPLEKLSEAVAETISPFPKAVSLLFLLVFTQGAVQGLQNSMRLPHTEVIFLKYILSLPPQQYLVRE